MSYARMLAVVQEAQLRGLADRHGYARPVELLRGVQNDLSRGEAKARMRAAGDVLPGRGLSGSPNQRSCRPPPTRSRTARSPPSTCAPWACR